MKPINNRMTARKRCITTSALTGIVMVFMVLFMVGYLAAQFKISSNLCRDLYLNQPLAYSVYVSDMGKIEENPIPGFKHGMAYAWKENFKKCYLGDDRL